MIEIRFHGRGGQGTVVASELLAQAAFLDGKMPQSFPFFGVERRGAPVTAYARIDSKPVGLRTSITNPDVVVVLDPGLVGVTPVTDGLRPHGLFLVNTYHPPEEIAAPPGIHRATVDATRIALSHGLGTAMLPIVNTAVLGAVARVTDSISLEGLTRAIARFVPARPTENQLAARDGYLSVRTVDGTAAEAARPPARPVPAAPFPEGPIASVPSDVLHTATWRTFTPILHLERCTKCNFCWKFCPDDAIEFDAKGFPKVRLEYCKGCGICAAECPPKTIEMVAES